MAAHPDFEQRAAYYPQRPSYPLSVLYFLREELKLNRQHIVADIGAGAGGSAKPLLRHVHSLCAVEPNAAMRQRAESWLGKEENWLITDGTAEASKLDDDSIDLALIAHSFPFIEQQAAHRELERILKLNSYVVVLHDRLEIQYGGFTEAFAQFLEQFGGNMPSPSLEELEAFYPKDYQTARFRQQLRLSWAELEGHYHSLPQALLPNQPRHSLAIRALKILFQEHSQHEHVVLEYETQLHFGLYNQYVPAISLRKSLFFQLLRPFAFLFYLLIKVNMLFWKMLFGNRSDDDG